MHQEVIHTDFGYGARKLYKYNGDSYKIMAQRHKAMARAGIPYWYQGYDLSLIHI